MSSTVISRNHNGIFQLLAIGPQSAWNSVQDKEIYVGMYFTAKEIIRFSDGLVYAYRMEWLADTRIHGTEYILGDGYSMFDIKIRKVRL